LRRPALNISHCIFYQEQKETTAIDHCALKRLLDAQNPTAFGFLNPSAGRPNGPGCWIYAYLTLSLFVLPFDGINHHHPN
jgi:hypothetical protein